PPDFHQPDKSILRHSDNIRQRVDWALKSVGMYDYRSGTPFRLSGGQKQRVAIAGVLALKPRVMVLDESTSMLDPVGRNEVMRVVETLNKKEKMTVIMITHFMEEALLADRIVVLDKGKILLEGGREIFEHREAIERAGLDIPIVMKVRDKLAQMGMEISRDIKDADALVEELCR
ncbi:MAG: ATP-binding cassette domain-containing protein, partial [Clostridia bacterium]|nr:ATP-binding cassette domain-containing protein [Clostridia bacterium]